MKICLPKLNATFVIGVLMLCFFTICLTSCEKDEVKIPQEEFELESEEYSAPTEDVLTVVSDLPAYVIPYEYSNFGKALVNRLQNRMTIVDEDSLEDLASLVLHSSHLKTMEDDWIVVLAQLLLGRNIIVVEPTIDDFNYFCNVITLTYILLNETDEGCEILDELDVIPGARQTLEAFYEISKDPSKLETMFFMNADSKGVFAEAIALRGCDFHIVDRMSGVGEYEITHEQIVDESGNMVFIETPDVNTAPGSDYDMVSPYSYGLFADMLTDWINDCEGYIDEMAELRSKAANMLNTRAPETAKYTLDEITSVQKVNYTMMAATPYNVSNPLPVTMSFEVCSIYMDKENADYYCIYKKIVSYNQMLDCGPVEKRKWRRNNNFGYEDILEVDKQYTKIWRPYDYYGPFMRDIEVRSSCQTNTETGTGLVGASVVQYSPKNSIGSVDKTNGFSYGFDGGLYFSSEPSANLGFSVSYDSSTTQTIDDLEITASTVNGIPEWKYKGQNLPDVFFNLVLNYSHSEAPKIMRLECEVDQSWIWKVPNPTGSYQLFDETIVSTSIMYYDTGFLKAYPKFANQATTKRVNFMMVTPPRCEQLWMMNVSPYSDELNSMLSTTHSRFWNKDDHEFKLNDTSVDSRISIEQFINDFERDLNAKRHTWKNRNFKGEFTFSYYNVETENNEPISFTFVVE